MATDVPLCSRCWEHGPFQTAFDDDMRRELHRTWHEFLVTAHPELAALSRTFKAQVPDGVTPPGGQRAE